MKTLPFTDEDGRMWLVGLPDDAPDSDAHKGIRIAPPSLTSLDLPQEVEIRLHNQLFARRLFTRKDVRARLSHVFGALQAAYKVDTGRIVQLYSQEGVKDGRRSVKLTPKKQVARRPRGGG